MVENEELINKLGLLELDESNNRFEVQFITFLFFSYW